LLNSFGKINFSDGFYQPFPEIITFEAKGFEKIPVQTKATADQ